jgi:hypothetical protein
MLVAVAGPIRSLREITSAFAYAGRLREEVPRVNELGGPSDESLSGGY